MPEKGSYPVVLLAAGASRRMGRPKQLLPVDGMPLVRRAAGIAVAAGFGHVFVVLGCRAAVIAPALAGLPLHLVINESWSDGLGSSIRAGVRRALELPPAPRGLVLALADQPGVSSAHLRRLAATQRRTGRSIVATFSHGVLQPPVLFTPEWFPRLARLRGDDGARKILREHAWQVARVPLAQASDLDTPGEYARYCAGRASRPRPKTA